MSNYYPMQLTTAGNFSNSAYFYVTMVGTPGTFEGAAVTIYPSNASTTWFSVSAQSLQFQSPAGRVGAGTTVVTDDPLVTGTLGVSPAITVATTLTLYGAGGQPIGSVTLQAGQTSIPFKFNAGGGMSSDDAAKQAQSFAEKPE